MNPSAQDETRIEILVRTGRGELPFPCGSQILTLVRLPIPPRSLGTTVPALYYPLREQKGVEERTGHCSRVRFAEVYWHRATGRSPCRILTRRAPSRGTWPPSPPTPDSRL